METISIILFIASCVGMSADVIALIIARIKKKRIKKYFILLAICFVLFVLSVIIMPESNNPDVKNSATPIITNTPTPEPTAKETAEPTDTPSPTSHPETTPEPTAEPTAKPTNAPNSTPEPKPTATPTSAPTSTPTPKTTSVPTSAPTAKPTQKPSDDPSSDTVSDAMLKSHKYIGSAESDKYHYTSCRHAKKILAENAIFFSNVDEAVSMGYSPCGVCKPR